jgi:predicted amidohydrolase
MPRRVQIAATQMDGRPAPTEERLHRAEQLVVQAAEAGAELVVLPELFNTGYTYEDINHRRAEPLDGPTVSWMKGTAARLKVHLAGSLMLLDEDEVYNALLLFAPDGRMWRYDKVYPWGWERGYFRNGRDVTVAQTDLGRIGMLICWDAGHPGLWRRYAGQVDLMVVSSCPPDLSDPVYHLPGGEQITAQDMGPVMEQLMSSGRRVWGDMLDEQAAWLGVPVVNTVGCGHITTPVPNGAATVLGIVPFAPHLLQYLPQASQLRVSCGFMPWCKIVDAAGHVVAQVTQEQGESFVTAEVTLADQTPQPVGRQPGSGLSPLLYLVSDVILPWMNVRVYRRGLRRAWGQRMAPVEPTTRHWIALLGVAVAFSLVAGWLWGRLSRRR